MISVTLQALKGIACWFIDTDYNEKSLFVRLAYLLSIHAVSH